MLRRALSPLVLASLAASIHAGKCEINFTKSGSVLTLRKGDKAMRGPFHATSGSGDTA